MPPRGRPPAGTEVGAGRNTLFSFLTQFSTAGFTAVLTLYLVRALGPREFGVFTLAVSVGALVYLPSDFGISGSASRFIAERRGDDSAIAALLSDALRLKLAISTSLSVLMIALAGPIADAYGEHSLEWPIRWIAIAVLGQSLVAFYRYAYLAIHEGSIGFRIVFGESAVETAASIAFVVAAGGAAAAGAGRATGYAAGSIIAIALTLRRFGRTSILGGHGLGSARGRPAILVGADRKCGRYRLRLVDEHRRYAGQHRVRQRQRRHLAVALQQQPARRLRSGRAPRRPRASPSGPAWLRRWRAETGASPTFARSARPSGT